MQMKPDDMPLPALRSDIQLNEAPPEPEGAPTWTLYDPAANKYYKIGWLEFECLSRFPAHQTTSQLVAVMRKETTLDVDAETIKALIMFLMQNNLVRASGEGAAPHFESLRALQQKPLWERIMHGYLFFTIPLFKPQAFLNKTYPIVRPLFTRTFMMGVLLLLSYGIFLSLSRIDELTTTFMNYLNFEGVMLLLVTTVIVKVVHELGHAYMATKYGVPVNIMGIAFIVMYPVLYTETTNAWKLQDRRDRLNIAAAGLMAELMLASVALTLWHYLTPGLAQSVCFMVGIVSLAASLAINLSPLMRFDGYYIFSDLVGIDNLQDRSFGFAKWRLRRHLWGWDDLPPEAVPAERENFLCAFGYAVWVYRFFLYLGIAILVNHIFFQPLGFILMMVELSFFIVLPIFKEMKIWWGRRDEIVVSRRGKVVMASALIAFLLLFFPFRTSIEIPAVLHARNYIKFYPPIAAKVEEVLVAQGETVKEGQLLFRLASPELDYNIALISRRLENLLAIRSSSQASPDLAKKRVTIDSEIERVRKELHGFEQIREQLHVKAPFAGQMKDMEPALRAGQWVDKGFMLGLLADESAWAFSGYVSEQDAARLPDNSAGTFYPELSPFRTLPAVVREIDKTVSYEVYWRELSSVYGGSIPAEKNSSGQIRPLPRHTIYAVRLEPLLQGADKAMPSFAARGTIHISGTYDTFAKLLFRKAVSAFRAEGSF